MTYPEWIKTHRRKFFLENYSIEEIIDLSRAVGWTTQEMIPTLRHWPRALHTSGDPDRAADKIGQEKADHFEATIERINGTSLDDQWHDLYDYSLGKTWDDKAA